MFTSQMSNWIFSSQVESGASSPYVLHMVSNATFYDNPSLLCFYITAYPEVLLIHHNNNYIIIISFIITI